MEEIDDTCDDMFSFEDCTPGFEEVYRKIWDAMPSEKRIEIKKLWKEFVVNLPLHKRSKPL